MKLLITTQYMENYGAHDWNGEGACPQYWKMKTKTYSCKCGHLAYYISRRGWFCHCSNPARKGPRDGPG
jgi:hypothetical protein